jgi:hypothetical protein
MGCGIKRVSLLFFSLFIFAQSSRSQHPISFFTKEEALLVRSNLKTQPLLNESFETLKKETDYWLQKEVDVPLPKDPAGGYTHERHKANYILMFNSAILYNITGEQKYADLVRNILLKYATLNPTLKNHPQATSTSPGRIFWQALNDANWMVYTGMAYDLVYAGLQEKDKKIIEEGAFKPEVDFVTRDLSSWFNLIHNHAVWATAGVGMIGIATNNQTYIDLALEGTQHNGSSGFYALLDQLFSPDGYYTEGPYYTRYALLPFIIFSNALNNKYPNKKIFNYRDAILKKAISTAIQYSNTDGKFFAFNDAMKDKDYTTSEMIMAVDIYTKAYGLDTAFLPIIKKQHSLLLTKSGIQLAEALNTIKNKSFAFPYKTIENTDGAKGNKGGVSILRSGKGTNLTSLIYKYSSHGLSHGHYDKLNINLFDKGNEILQDYGAARFVGVEQKYGGRYLPENAGFATQTIAHNTMVVDESSHFNGNEKISELYYPSKNYSNFENEKVLAISVSDSNAYKNVTLRRSLFMLTLPDQPKLVIDIFHAQSTSQHQYDLPFYYLGQFIHSTVNYNYSKSAMYPLGKKNGYQYLWKEAEAKVADTIAQMTFLNDRDFYTISSMINDSASILFARIGANDLNFNLRRDPAFIIRKNCINPSFINVIEMHGKYDPVNEVTSNANSIVQKIQEIENSLEYNVIEIQLKTGKLLFIDCKGDNNSKTQHQYLYNNAKIVWEGPYLVMLNGKNINK